MSQNIITINIFVKLYEYNKQFKIIAIFLFCLLHKESGKQDLISLSMVRGGGCVGTHSI